MSKKLRAYQLSSLVLLIVTAFLSGVIYLQGQIIRGTTKDMKFLLEQVQEKDETVSSLMFERAFVLQALRDLQGRLDRENKKLILLELQLDKQRSEIESASISNMKKIAKMQKWLTFYKNANNTLSQEKYACIKEHLNIEIRPDTVELYYKIPTVEIASN